SFWPFFWAIGRSPLLRPNEAGRARGDRPARERGPDMQAYRSFVLSLASALVLTAGSAVAAPLPFTGTLSVAFSDFGAGPAFVGSGVGSSAGGVGSPVTVPAGFLSITSTVAAPITPPALGMSLITVPASPGAPITNAAGSFAPGSFPNGGTLGGAMANNALARFWFAPTTTQPCTGGCPAGTVPLKYFGGGGTGMGVLAGIPLTIVGAVWSNLGVDETTPTRVLKLQ